MNRAWVGAAFALALVACACGGNHSAPATASPARAPATTAALALDAGCAPMQGRDARVDDPRGPYYHQVVVARSDDGLVLRDAHQVLDHASVADAVVLPDGRAFVYYVNGEHGATWVAELRDGEVRPLGPISLDGISPPAGAVDPDATALPGGRIRLGYLAQFGEQAPDHRWTICLADSTNGRDFTVIGRAISFDETTTDPSLLQLPGGGWLMAASQGQATVLARSNDGLVFEPYAHVTYGGVPELALTADGRVRLYVCGRGIEAYASGDGGATWAREAMVIMGTRELPIACDPSRAGSWFVYKTAP